MRLLEFKNHTVRAFWPLLVGKTWSWISKKSTSCLFSSAQICMLQKTIQTYSHFIKGSFSRTSQFSRNVVCSSSTREQGEVSCLPPWFLRKESLSLKWIMMMRQYVFCTNFLSLFVTSLFIFPQMRPKIFLWQHLRMTECGSIFKIIRMLI